jgi:hypothetical protein
VQRGYGRKPSRYIVGHNARDPRTREARTERARAAWARRRAATPDPVFICQCGCGEAIPFKPGHRYKPPKYIPEHYRRVGGAVRLEKIRAAGLKARLAPPPEWVAPSGLCACGCGGRTAIAKTSRPGRGEYNGYPKRFIHGHNARLFMPEQTSGWKGGRTTDRYGYVAVHRPDYPGATKTGYVLVHRMVYEESRGVRLPAGVLVHHVNGVRDDNRPENLVAFTRVEHRRAHTLAQEIIGLFLDDRLLEAAKAHVRAHGELPDLEALTAQVYGGA